MAPTSEVTTWTAGQEERTSHATSRLARTSDDEIDDGERGRLRARHAHYSQPYEDHRSSNGEDQRRRSLARRAPRPRARFRVGVRVATNWRDVWAWTKRPIRAR